MHKIYLRQALMHACGFSRVLRHSNSNNTFISIVFGFFGTPCIYVFKNSLIIHEEKTKEITAVSGGFICDKKSC